MSARTAILLSLGLNAVLLAAACWLARRQQAPATEPPVARAIPNHATEPAAGEAGRAYSPPPATAARFHWSMIESRDYPTYIANLRAIGCPEPTIRDVIFADVSELFVRKRQAMLEPLERRFWDLLA